MAMLDPEPRLASVTALEETKLLRLDQQPFFELMEDRVEVAYGVIHVLSGRLRHLVRDVTEFSTRIQALETQLAGKGRS
jgi:CRP-like cAMP-binding protein